MQNTGEKNFRPLKFAVLWSRERKEKHRRSLSFFLFSPLKIKLIPTITAYGDI